MKFQMKKKLLIAALVPAFGLMGAASHAQTGDAQRAQQERPAAATERSQQQQQNIRDMRASELIGATVRDEQGEELGDVQDLIVDVSDERVNYAILAFGGVLGFGEKLFAYPMDRFQATGSGDEKELVLSVSEEELKNAPGFDRSNWPTFGAGGYRGEVDEHFGQTAKAGGNLARMSELLDMEVSDRADNEVGQIEDVVVSVTNGQVRFVALEPGEDLNLGDRIVMLPMAAINATSEKQFEAQSGAGASGETASGAGTSAETSGASEAQQERQEAQQGAAEERAEQSEQAREDAADKQQAQQDAQEEGDPQTTGGTAQQSAAGQPQREGQAQPSRVEADAELKLVLNVAPNQLANARSFQTDQWPDLNSRTFQNEMDRYVAAFPSGGATTGESPAGEGAAGAPGAEEQEQTSGASGKADEPAESKQPGQPMSESQAK